MALDDTQLAFLRTATPQIAPLQGDGGDRPFWSIIIPTYRRSDFLEKALTSVLSQDRGRLAMQIEVADDASPDTEIRDMVARIGEDRIGYHRQPQNVGQFTNVNAAIGRARGRWIHVLHDDDWVEDGFYASLEASLPISGPIGAALARTHVVDQGGQLTRTVQPQRPEAGILPHALVRLSTSAVAQTPAVVVRRDVYETVGGYNPDFSITGDWEMWQRIAAHYDWWYDPGAFACYRSHPTSVSGEGKATGRNVSEARAVIEFAQNYLPADLGPAIARQARKHWAIIAGRTARRMVIQRNYAGAAAQLRECLLIDPSEQVVKSVISMGADLARGGITL